MKACRLLLLGLLSLPYSNVIAQTACPPGMTPYGVGVCGYDNSQPQQSAQPRPQQPLPPQWASRWGAIATDGPGGHLGVAINLSSKSAAEQEAIADCQAKGGLSCAIEVAYDNECAAMVVGHTEHSSNAASTLDEAIHLGMLTCDNAGDTNCHVYYSACSLPVRTQ